MHDPNIPSDSGYFQPGHPLAAITIETADMRPSQLDKECTRLPHPARDHANGREGRVADTLRGRS
jgi:hypothetical protein